MCLEEGVIPAVVEVFLHLKNHLFVQNWIVDSHPELLLPRHARLISRG